MNLLAEITRLNKRMVEVEKLLNVYQEPFAITEKFLNDKCELRNDLKVEAKHLYKVFIDWMESESITNACGSRTFYSNLRDLGYEVRKGTKNKVYVYGVAFKKQIVEGP
ncbi:primase-like DNA-binding domain-containing protein [Cytobacillus luteolus]|uniref:primase-like DNA-binding domain-containing protein n=1 Tax=Litchfieldia luteola TaxID=682179 RepID=UPI001AE1781D|nr:primase-like DNA-binding domain-containing protein [Cytobacillus luteolus]MBP1944637.1 phage/plasmid-associated DNA primase [Cytobacillus luteolus]